jgi:lipoprotein-releasing system permease protein
VECALFFYKKMPKTHQKKLILQALWFISFIFITNKKTLNTPYFIFKRTTLHAQGLFGKMIVKIAVAGIAIGLAVMLVAVAVVGGFQKTIPDEITGFWGHIQISKLNANNTTESQPMAPQPQVLLALQRQPNIAHTQAYALKAAIAKTTTDFEGVVLKGIQSGFDPQFLQRKMLAGKPISITPNDSAPSSQCVVSNTLARRLRLHIGDRLPVYFIEQPPRVRAFTIVGIYSLDIETELGKPIVLCDLRHIQKLNDWTQNEIGGYEIFIKNLSTIDATTRTVRQVLPIELNAQNIKELYPQLFSWLNLFDTNQSVIIFIMILVAGINMISALLILILEKTRTIGLLKTLGMNNKNIKQLFFYTGAYLILIGMALGNFMGLMLIMAQRHTGFLKLPAQSYYVSQVPVHITTTQILWLNIGTLLACAAMLAVPLLVIGKMRPVQAINFD